MRAAVISIDSGQRLRERQGSWWLLEIARPGRTPMPYGVLVLNDDGEFALRMKDPGEFGDLAEDEADFLDFLEADLKEMAARNGGAELLRSLEDSLSNYLRISDRTVLSFGGSAQRAADRLFDEHVDGTVKPFVTHLPVYTLRAAATRFGEGMQSEQEGWTRFPESLRVSGDMFVAHVVGRSMEPLIPDGSLCVFRAGVKGSRQGKRLLIEQFGETDFASRYTVKRYTSAKKYGEDGGWEHERIRLEPLNPEFPAFELGPDEFRVVAEFVEVLD